MIRARVAINKQEPVWERERGIKFLKFSSFDVFVNEKSIGGKKGRTKGRKMFRNEEEAGSQQLRQRRKQARSFAWVERKLCMRLLQPFLQFIDFPFGGLRGMIYEYWLRWHGLADYVTKKEQILLCLAINIFPFLNMISPATLSHPHLLPTF